MTSTANQQNTVPAPTTATTASSYASAAGAPKKPASQQPVVVAGSQQPPVVVASSASPAQNAKPASPAPVNGKPAVAPAVPAVVRGTTNGAHSRQSSVTMASNGPNSFTANGGSVGGGKSGIQFGFDSPAVSHSTPQSGTSAPIPIPGGNPRVSTPSHSPSPIPQPSASGGGRPPSGLAPASGQMTFGSLSSDGERHMRQGSLPPNHNGPGAHFRRESNHSIQSDHAGRGNFVPQGGRGRGGYNPNYNNQMGYPPNNQFRNNGGQGRGMPPAFQPQPRNMPYPNSPQPNHRSPAMAPSMPGTPNMPPANMQPNMAMQTPPQHHYAPPMAPQYSQVQPPFSSASNKLSFKNKKSKQRPHKLLQPGRRSDPARELYSNDFSTQGHRFSNRTGRLGSQEFGRTLESSSGNSQKFPPESYLDHENPHNHPPISLDMSPGNYEHLLLTMKRQNYGFPPQQLDSYGRQYAGYNMQYMPPPQTNSPAYNQAFVPPPYQQHQHAHSMSRTPSQPERPPSATQQAPAVAMGSNNKQPNPAAQAFQRPKKSGAIPIKTASGEVLDPTTFKVPASPASSTHQTKTPPATAAAATPPPKSVTPAHGRTDSTATVSKTAKQIQDELKEKIKQATQGASKPKDEKPAEETPAVSEPAPEPQTSAPAASEPTPAAEPVKEEPVKKAEEPKKEEPAKAPEPSKPDQMDDDEMERIIREMEEEDARREKEQEEYRIKKEAEKAAAKAKADENRKTNAADEDQRLREQEREMERLEEEKEKKRLEAEQSGKAVSIADALAGRSAPQEEEAGKVDAMADKLAGMKIDGDKPSSEAAKLTTAEKRGVKPAALNLAPLNTKSVEPAQPSAALQSLQSARFLKVVAQDIYPEGIKSPNPALNAAVAKKGKTFKYDANFLLQFQAVFTEQPSLEFHQQVKTLIGDGDGGRSASGRAQTPGSARQGSRGAGAGFNMGAFNAPPDRRTLPTGTSSAERFAMSSGAMPRPNVNPMGTLRGPGGGAFPMSASMSRTSSQSNMGPNSPRQSSRRGAGSRRDQGAKEAQAAKTMPLTAGIEIKPIAVSSSGWKPTSIGKGGSGAAGTPSGHMDPEMVQRKVKAALNKMTPENFERISDQILVITSQSKDEADGRTLRQVIQLTFEKATDEAHWASMYAKFCKKMLETMSPDIKDERIKDRAGNVVSGGPLFRKYLLNRCQEEFERGWANVAAAEPEDKEKEKADAEKKPGEAAMLSDEYYIAAAAKRRGLGLVQFIGELYKLGMLTERIMLECVHRLIDAKGPYPGKLQDDCPSTHDI
jgi:translation initiation factor 4G